MRWTRIKQLRADDNKRLLRSFIGSANNGNQQRTNIGENVELTTEHWGKSWAVNKKGNFEKEYK